MGVYDNDIWNKMGDEKIEAFIETINSALEPITFDPANVSVKSTDLDFYDDYALYQISDYEAIPNVKKYILYRADNKDIVPVTWTNQPIYELNKKAPIVITDETVIDYIKFFFHYVRGRHGRFLIVEHVDDIQWKETPPPNARKALIDLIEPVRIVSKGKDGSITLSCNMVFKDSLFKSNVLIDGQGKVSLHDEEILVEGMPVLIETS